MPQFITMESFGSLISTQESLFIQGSILKESSTFAKLIKVTSNRLAKSTTGLITAFIIYNQFSFKECMKIMMSLTAVQMQMAISTASQFPSIKLGIHASVKIHQI